jgi:N-acetylmuramoyl-L-alanine amidase
MRLVISSGHGLHVRGARGFLDERDENVRVTDRVAAILRANGVHVETFHDNTSRSVAANLNAIVGFHNARNRDRDISVHFNAFRTTDSAMGTECLHRNQAALAARVSTAMARGGRFRDRGPKHRTNLAFLNRCNRPAILLEVCFVDSREDTRLYRENFEAVCREIASSISGQSIGTTPPPPTPGARPVIRQGARGDMVTEAQRLLNRAPTALPRLVEDGIFGPRTDARTREFQTAQGITVDGIIGPVTWGRLTA